MQIAYTIDNGEIITAPAGTKAHWLRVQAPSTQELEELTTQYHLPPSYVLAATDPHEDPRIDGFNDDHDTPAFMLLRFPVESRNAMGYRQYITQSVALFIWQDWVMTIANQPIPINEKIPNAPFPLTADPESFTLQLTWTALHQFVDAMDKLNGETASLEGSLGHAAKNTQMYQIMSMQKSLIYFENALRHSQDFLRQLVSNDRYFTTAAYLDQINAVSVEASQAQSMVSTTERVLEQYNSAVSSVISNNLNLIMKVLTSLTIILTIPTIVGGIYGMNVRLPFAHAYNAFWWLMAITAVLCALVAWWLHRHDYF